MLIKHRYRYLFLITVLIWSPCYGDWESDANARIESIRKRNAEITVVDSYGAPAPGINVEIEQIKHRFAFGTCIRNSQMSNTTYKNFILNHFEWAVCENDTKWKANEPTRDNVNYTNADSIYNWCNSNGIKMRGHCLFWEQVNDEFPSWVESLPYATYPTWSELLGEVDERIDGAVSHFNNKFYNWDVDNEMLTDDFFTSRLGDAGIAHMFQRAKSVDPDGGMFMNEYSGNSFGGYDSGRYVSRANSLISMGAPIDGLGIQGHLGADLTFYPQQYYDDVLQPLAALELPIWVTEFDASHSNENISADNIEDYFRICFSHPKVEGIIMWGFMQGQMWRGNAYLITSGGALTARGLRYEALMDEWTTSDSNTTDGSGEVDFRGFHGTYEITLSYPGQTTEIHTIELEPGGTTALYEIETDIEVPMPDTTPPTPDPMTWSSYPTATGSSTITMTASTATDTDSPPVQYYFECTTDGSKSSGWQTSTTYVATGLTPSTLYSFKVKARDSYTTPNETGFSSTQSATTSEGTGQTPYPGPDLHAIPGRIEAENYDDDGEGVAYHDTTSGNSGGDYRSDDVDVETCGEGGFNVGWIASGEWLEYSVNVATTGTYDIEARVASQSDGGNFHIEFDGYDVTDTVSFAATGGWQDYTSVFVNDVSLTAGVYIMRVSMDSSNWNVNWVEFTITGDITPPAAPTGLAATAGNETVSLDWNDNGEPDMNGYNVYRSTTSGSDYGQINSSLLGSSDYIDDTVTNGIPYYYVVKAVDVSDNESGYSNEASATPDYQNCSQVLAAGYGLTSDIYGDCYVNYKDLKVITDYWLNTECDLYDNCEGADFEPTDSGVDFYDFSNFAVQWMLCNDPENPGECPPNW